MILVYSLNMIKQCLRYEESMNEYQNFYECKNLSKRLDFRHLYFQVTDVQKMLHTKADAAHKPGNILES